MLSKGSLIMIITVIAAVIAGAVTWLRMQKMITETKDSRDYFLYVYLILIAVLIEVVIMGVIIVVGAEISLLVDPEWIISELERALNVNLH